MNSSLALRNLILPIVKIDRVLPTKGLIYEVGSGYGGLAVELAIRSPERQIVALDIDKQKIKHAHSAFQLNHVTFVRADAMTYPFLKCAGVILSDFLHHVTFLNQEKILKRLTRVLTRDGILVIKEIDASDGVRRHLSRLWDALLYPHDKIFYRSRESWGKFLEQLGYTVRTSREVSWFPGSTHLYICKKK